MTSAGHDNGSGIVVLCSFPVPGLLDKRRIYCSKDKERPKGPNKSGKGKDMKKRRNRRDRRESKRL